MQIWKKIGIYTCGMILTGTVFITSVTAGGPPLKDNACGACHRDYGAIMPQKHPDMGKGTPCLTCHTTDAKTEATKFSTEVHKTHQGGKTKLECSACHAL
ncbi:MAG: cytochrome c3 family protein [Deltaproteobacteria bacterium]|nr:cytochrome c3 family protein [Deltaproteobacteria bacterium]